MERKPLVTNAGSADQARRARRQERRAEAESDAAWATVMSTDAGQRVLRDILEYCGVFESVFTPSSQIYHNAGRQDVGHFIVGQVAQAAPDEFLHMMRQAYLPKDN